MGFGITRPGGGVPGARPDQSVGRAAGLGAAAPAAPGDHPGVQIGHGGVGFGVQDGVHVLGPADQTQQRHRLVGGHHQLHPGPFGVYQTGPGGGSSAPPGPKIASYSASLTDPGQAQVRGARAAPNQRCLAPRRVVFKRLAGVVVGSFEDRFPVIVDRVDAHHSHPCHGVASSVLGPPRRAPQGATGRLQSCSSSRGGRGRADGWEVGAAVGAVVSGFGVGVRAVAGVVLERSVGIGVVSSLRPAAGRCGTTVEPSRPDVFADRAGVHRFRPIGAACRRAAASDRRCAG